MRKILAVGGAHSSPAFWEQVRLLAAGFDQAVFVDEERGASQHHHDNGVSLVVFEADATLRGQARTALQAKRLMRQYGCSVAPIFVVDVRQVDENRPRTRHKAKNELEAAIDQRMQSVVASLRQQRSLAQDIAASLVKKGNEVGAASLGMLAESRAGMAANWGAVSWQLVEHNTVLRGAGWAVRSTQSWVSFLERLQRQGAAVSLPILDADGRHLIVAANQFDYQGRDHLLFVFFDARKGFLDVLDAPGFHPSFETYAFDSNGDMVSESRFCFELFERGVLDSPLSSALGLRVEEPSGASAPLTKAAGHALHNIHCLGPSGYVDYRGEEVWGVWRWNTEFEFGLAAEVDQSVLCLSSSG